MGMKLVKETSLTPTLKEVVYHDVSDITILFDSRWIGTDALQCYRVRSRG